MDVAPISEEAWKTIQERVEGFPGGWRPSSCTPCAFGFVDRRNGAASGPWSGAACHASLAYGIRDVPNPKGGMIVVNSLQPSWGIKNPDLLFWLAREAPFSNGILNSDKDYEILNHAVVIDIAQTGQAGALWLCKAFRHFAEDTWKLDTWSLLREEGLTGLQAFIGADILTKEGNPNAHGSHVSLFCYGSPEGLRKDYDEIRSKTYLAGNQAARGFGGYYEGVKYWGGLKHKKRKIPDGWGGFTEVSSPCSVKEYASQLKEIFEGDPKNVG